MTTMREWTSRKESESEMKITKRKTKTGCTITVTAKTEADKKQLADAVLSGSLLRALNAIGQTPQSITLTQNGRTER